MLISPEEFSTVCCDPHNFIVSEAEVDVFLELLYFSHDPIYIINLISDSSAFSKKGWTSLVAQLVKNLPAMWETWVQSLGWEDPLEKGKATHSSILS